MTAVDCVLDCKAKIGEGRLVGRPRPGGVVGRHRGPDPPPLRSRDRAEPGVDLPSRIGCFAPREAGGFVVALEDGFHFFDPEPAPSATSPTPRPTSRTTGSTTARSISPGGSSPAPCPWARASRWAPSTGCGRTGGATRCSTGLDRLQRLRLQPGRPDLLLLRFRGQRAHDLGLRLRPAAAPLDQPAGVRRHPRPRRPAGRRHGRRGRLLLDGRRRRLAAGPLHARGQGRPDHRGAGREADQDRLRRRRAWTCSTSPRSA